jgi:uncharacterized protein YdbL (DUF1318 family)
MLLVVTVITAAAAAQSVGKAELKQRFEQRYAQLQQLKKDGAVGETSEGFVAAVAPGVAAASDVAAFVEQENRDRTLLYRLLADELKADLAEPEQSMMTPTVVAERNARRNFGKAAAIEQLRVAEGIWVTKRTHPWVVRLLALEEKGLVGETSEGYVASVGSDAGEPDANRVIEQENEARRERYERLAREQAASVERIARREAELRFEAAHRGVFLRRDDGTWKRK